MKTFRGLLVVVILFLLAIPAGAIVYGEPDGNGHPNVAAVIYEYDSATPLPEQACTGTLISSTHVLTAAHCDPDSARPDDPVFISFDQDVVPVTSQTTLYPGVFIAHPEFNRQVDDPRDVALIRLDSPIQGVAPARLPAARMLDEMKDAGTLHGHKFTAVGYGVQAVNVGGGRPTVVYEGERWRATSEFHALTPAWLRLSQNPATGDGGSCSGDSGGPNFLGAGQSETNIVAAITVRGDSFCRATNDAYRMDTESARSFLGNYVDLP